jgi:hypothetical protein
MKRMYPYKMYSRGGRALAKALGLLRVYPKKWKPKPGDKILNWGSSVIPQMWRHLDFVYNPNNWINFPSCVATASNKLKTLEELAYAGASYPPFTTDSLEAEDWLLEGNTVVVRHLLRSHSGNGIVVLNSGDEVPEAPLYTLYKKKKEEYRVHAFKDKVVDVQQKKKKKGVEIQNQIRNYQNGWVYCRDGINPPQEVLNQGILACNALGLDFAAVDIGWNEKLGEATVYEVNTAPGLVGTTVEIYKSHLLNL